MRRLIIAVAVGAIVLGLGLVLGTVLGTPDVAYADGGPHSGGAGFAVTTEGCASCHRAHTGVGPRMLAQADVASLCLSCHNGTGADLDVVDGARVQESTTATQPNNIGGALRGGGFVYARIMDYALGCTGTADKTCTQNPGLAMPNSSAGLPVASAHIKGALGSSNNHLTAKNIIWGNGTSSGAGKDLNSAPNHDLTCGDCHDPHGNGMYRILRPIPFQSDASNPVNLTDVPTSTTTGNSNKIYTVTNYWTYLTDARTQTLSGPFLPTGSSTWSTRPSDGAGKTIWQAGNMADWCAQCHTRYEAGKDSGHTDSGDTTFKYRHSSNGTRQITPATGPYKTMTFTAECLQCHVSHGSNSLIVASTGTRPSAVRIPWPDGTTPRGDVTTNAPVVADGTTANINANYASSGESTLLRIRGRGTCVACHGTDGGQFSNETNWSDSGQSGNKFGP